MVSPIANDPEFLGITFEFNARTFCLGRFRAPFLSPLANSTSGTNPIAAVVFSELNRAREFESLSTIFSP